MKKLFIVPLICVLALTLCLGGTAFAQEEEGLPDPGITPDSPFYFADKWSKQLALMFTFKAENKVQKALQYAEERLAEVDAMLTGNKFREVTEANNQYQNCLNITMQYMERARIKGVDTSETVVLAVSEHLGFVNDSMVGAPEDALMLLTQTRERARTCQETALISMAQGDPEKAIQTNLMLMECQLNRMNAQAEEEQGVNLKGELQEYERLSCLGEEISQIAREMGKGTSVDQLVAQATANRLQVLAQVRQRVQEQSQQMTNNATQNRIENHEMVVTESKAQNQQGQTQEGPPVPAEISEKMKNNGSVEGSKGK